MHTRRVSPRIRHTITLRRIGVTTFMGLLRALVAGLVVFVGLNTQANAADDAGLAPTTERIVSRLFRDGLISTYFDSEVRTIASHYARRSEFAGNVRVNEAPDPNALNVYVFHYAEGHPAFLRNNCNSFPRDRVIVCDHRLLDSIPSSLPIALSANQGIPPPFLMYWVIGHETGHVVLGHDRAAFLSFISSASTGSEMTPVAGNDTSRPTTKDSVRTLNSFEVDADRFAVSSLPVSSTDQWMYFGLPLIDAIGWELPKARSNTTNRDGTPVAKPNPTLSERGIPSDGPVIVRVRDGHHPPLVLRLYDLVSTIRSTYTDFPLGNAFFVPPTTFAIEKVPARREDAREDPNAGLFYGTIYLGSDFSDAGRAHALLDRALYMRLLGQEPFAGALLEAACKRQDETSEVWRWQYALACGSKLQPPPGDPFTLVSRCQSLDAQESLRCYALIPLFRTSCKRPLSYNGRPFPTCRDEDKLKSIDERYANHHFPMPRDSANLRGWMLLARYLYARDVLRSSEEVIDQWTLQVAEESVVNYLDRTGWELLWRHADYLLTQPSERAWRRLYDVYLAQSELAKRVGNDAWAVEHRKRVIELIDRHLPPAHPAHGFHRLILARVLREYGLHIFGSNDPLRFAAMAALKDDLPSRATRFESIRAEAGPVSESAAASYLVALRAAQETNDRELIESRHESFLNALAELVFSYNFTYEPAKALDAAKRVLAEIESAKSLRKREGFDVRVLAPAFENCATAFLTSPDGDVQLAVRYAQEALSIRLAANQKDSVVALRTLAYSFFRAGDNKRAHEVARRYVQTFEEVYRRQLSLDEGMLVAGKFVSLRDLLAENQEDRIHQVGPTAK